MCRALSRAHDVHVLHHRRDRGVVLQPRHVVAHFLDRLVKLAQHGGIGRARAPGLEHARPEPVEKSPNAGDALVLKIAALLIWSDEHEVRAKRVRAPPFDILVRNHHVAAALRHLRPVTNDRAVRAELRERLLELDVSGVV